MVKDSDMEMGFVKPSYPNEKRVSLLPQHVKKCFGKVVIESGFGHSLGIDDSEYVANGAVVSTRKEIFGRCEFIYCLKLLQPSDYQYLREGQVVIGWTHPTGSGSEFFNTVCQDKKLKIVDLDSQFPRLYYLKSREELDCIPRGFINKNSRLAGFSSVQHALMSHGLRLNSDMRVAVLSVGNVAHGALSFLQRFAFDIDIFTRSNMQEFIRSIDQYDVIVSGVEVDSGHVISNSDRQRIKKGALVIDAAADANGAIQGTRYTSIDLPIYREDGVYYYVVNNSPSILYREASNIISESFARYVYSLDPQVFIKGIV